MLSWLVLIVKFCKSVVTSRSTILNCNCVMLEDCPSIATSSFDTLDSICVMLVPPTFSSRAEVLKFNAKVVAWRSKQKEKHILSVSLVVKASPFYNSAVKLSKDNTSCSDFFHRVISHLMKTKANLFSEKIIWSKQPFSLKKCQKGEKEDELSINKHAFFSIKTSW